MPAVPICQRNLHCLTKTIRTDLKYLEEVGVIRKEPGGRPYRYMLQQDVLTKLTAQEQLELYDFVDIMANTQVPSVQGYLLRDSLKKAIAASYPEQEVTEPFIYKYHYYSRILDEAHLYTLLSAIRQCKRVQFVYFSPKTIQLQLAKYESAIRTGSRRTFQSDPAARSCI